MSTHLNKIVGCVGITSHSNVDSIANCKPNIYTVHRLVVDSSMRGQGIGNILIRAIQDYVTWRESSAQSILIATTPAVMQAANQLYYSNGFKVQQEIQLGKMMIKTVFKTLNM